MAAKEKAMKPGTMLATPVSNSALPSGLAVFKLFWANICMRVGARATGTLRPITKVSATNHAAAKHSTKAGRVAFKYTIL
eukprot:CAMPEP_0178404774 /NCGR_PEP_ID=MMETSP0689_2-20121128/18061_1 /TAXON_ID=160604 /ORGANISM="Amphidinium massartii, Strain CS-259" /LENGTH=79 /DNA_ID=CAMNT_0020025777 /DNA_START=252 /DNA_END=491 /DNA_ORIENTATION=-